MPNISTVLTAAAPSPGGNYSQAVVCGNLIYVSGQLPIRADGTHTNQVSFAEQAQQSLGNLLAIVEAAGGTRESLLRVTAYIVGISNWPIFNAVYGELLQGWRPARTVIPVPELHFGYLVEVDAIAQVEARAGRR